MSNSENMFLSFNISNNLNEFLSILCKLMSSIKDIFSFLIRISFMPLNQADMDKSCSAMLSKGSKGEHTLLLLILAENIHLCILKIVTRFS